MTLKQLAAFYWAAKLGSFAIAADRLSISQSSLSKRIAELESNLNVELFDRSARRAVLTEAGVSALVEAQKMLTLEIAIRQKTSAPHGAQGTLRFGFGELAAATWFPKFLKTVETAYPDLDIEPLVSQARSMELNVERGTLDCAVIAGLSTRAQLESVPLCTVAFSWMSAPDLVMDGPLGSPETLCRHPLIAPNLLSGQLQAFNDWVSSTGTPIEKVIRCNSLNAIVEMTVAGAGISLLPLKHMAPILRRKLLVQVPSEPRVAPLQYSFIWRRDDLRPLTRLAKNLVVSEVDFDLTTPLWQ